MMTREKAVAAIGPNLMDGLLMYVEQHIPTGGFLEAVLSNDLREACMRANEHSRTVLFELVFWLCYYAPSACWGSREKYERWLS